MHRFLPLQKYNWYTRVRSAKMDKKLEQELLKQAENWKKLNENTYRDISAFDLSGWWEFDQYDDKHDDKYDDKK